MKMKNIFPVLLWLFCAAILPVSGSDPVVVRFVRHGQPGVRGTHFSAEDKASWIQLGLTPLGRKQARITGEFLKKEGRNYQYVIASPQERASETADIICSVLGKKFTLSPDLREVGNPVRETLPQLRKRFKNIAQEENMNLTVAQKRGFRESGKALGQRGRKFIMDLVKSGKKGPFLLVTHGHFMYMTIREMTGQNFRPWNCGMSELKVWKDGRAVLVKGAYPEVFTTDLVTCNQTYFHKAPWFSKFTPHPGPRPKDISFVEKEFTCLLKGENSSWRKTRVPVKTDLKKGFSVTEKPLKKTLTYWSPDFPVKAGKDYVYKVKVSGKGKGTLRAYRIKGRKDFVLTDKPQVVEFKFNSGTKEKPIHVFLDIHPGTELTWSGFSIAEK